MDKILEIWGVLRQLFTSRTMWGLVVALLGMAGVDANGWDSMALELGDKLIAAAGALLAVIGYVDRRPKPGMVEVAVPQ